MAGLIGGTVLQRQGIDVTVLDKGRGIGGRLATRRIVHPIYGEGVFDYGMQLFAVSDPSFQQWVDEWLQQGVIDRWFDAATGTPGYRGTKSSRSIAQHLAKDLDVWTQTTALELTWESSAWLVRAENGDRFQGDNLLITAPVPQTLALLDNSAIDLPLEIRHRLESVFYQPCLTLLALLDKPSAIPAPGGLRLDDPVLAWLACNQQKGTSPQAAAVTIQATPEFSHTHWEMDKAAISDILIDRASQWLGANVVEFQVHRWLYSQPQTCYGDVFLALQQPGIFAIAGDAFSATNVADPSLQLERAARSGIAAANYLLKMSNERAASPECELDARQERSI